MDFKNLKNSALSVFYESLPHIIICLALSLFNFKQVWIIFFIGLIFPDSIICFYKVFGTWNFKKVEKTVKVFHQATLIISIVALFLGYPLIFLAGLSHVLLDFIGL